MLSILIYLTLSDMVRSDLLSPSPQLSCLYLQKEIMSNLSDGDYDIVEVQTDTQAASGTSTSSSSELTVTTKRAACRSFSSIKDISVSTRYFISIINLVYVVVNSASGNQPRQVVALSHQPILTLE